MKHSLQLKLSQHLTLTPQLQQSIRLLQLSTLDLNQELEQFIENNPLLERVDPNQDEVAPLETSSYTGDGEVSTSATTTPTEESSEDNSASEDIWDEAMPSHAARDDNDEPDFPQQDAKEVSLRDHLNWQLNLTQLSLRDRTMVSLMIDALSDDGYLTQSLDDIAAMLPPELEIDPLELDTALKYLQNLDPIGVGARNLSECLALQLEAMPVDTPCRKAALQIARQHLELLGSRDYNKLKKLLQCDDDVLRGAQSLITHLNPRPGSAFTASDTRYVVADVIVKKIKGTWVASLNREAMPKLRVNRMYADILSRNREGGGQQLASQLQEARWMVKNIQQRFDTILRVSQAIVDRQRRFFEHGEVAMRPLVLREIADEIGLHESTISRVTTQKYMLTPRGIFELKYFFGSHVATETGGACSATAIRALIKQLVGAEDSKKPLSDTQITEILAQQGIVVARRTVAKYREAMQIPAVTLRKSL
ncbi:RNA polymerase sigma-54 factor [Sulfurimicrobium lacus]|uniref:RNA polymerase sigma-54 factor n=1 Tax=Sulfurimicrobium lacus TaxID=2715678 RepID=A0A6F8VHF3_9PROT|nr:RNA polymerase factor sigma-54 [Sulfurimicrobium lacus]BCB28456.1 RNA polymerase sigma-54 factor [Sulfurimicrobium lacus]